MRQKRKVNIQSAAHCKGVCVCVCVALINLTARHTYQATFPLHISHSEYGNCNLTALTAGVAKHQKPKFIPHLGLKEYKHDKI
jgi:hypothetical protein